MSAKCKANNPLEQSLCEISGLPWGRPVVSVTSGFKAFACWGWKAACSFWASDVQWSHLGDGARTEYPLFHKRGSLMAWCEESLAFRTIKESVWKAQQPWKTIIIAAAALTHRPIHQRRRRLSHRAYGTRLQPRVCIFSLRPRCPSRT